MQPAGDSLHLQDLPLCAPTSSVWLETALGDVDALLADHAQCEHKAASAALALVARHPGDRELTRSMLALAHEEMRHLSQVLDLMERRGLRPGRPRANRYVGAIRRRFSSEGRGLGGLADALLVDALVEARSCERFRLLSAGLATDSSGGELSRFFGRLAQAEFRHWNLFRDLAARHSSVAAVRLRLPELARMEAEVLAALPISATLHAGGVLWPVI